MTTATVRRWAHSRAFFAIGTPLTERYLVTESCWLWQGATNIDGYGTFRKAFAHRLVYEHFRGPIPDGLTLDHLCRNRSCVNPDHLEPVTNRENILRGNGTSAINARKTHCIHGHEFTPENTYMFRGHRACRACHRATAALSRRRRGAKS